MHVASRHYNAGLANAAGWGGLAQEALRLPLGCSTVLGTCMRLLAWASGVTLALLRTVEIHCRLPPLEPVGSISSTSVSVLRSSTLTPADAAKLPSRTALDRCYSRADRPEMYCTAERRAGGLSAAPQGKVDITWAPGVSLQVPDSHKSFSHFRP